MWLKSGATDSRIDTKTDANTETEEQCIRQFDLAEFDLDRSGYVVAIVLNSDKRQYRAVIHEHEPVCKPRLHLHALSDIRVIGSAAKSLQPHLHEMGVQYFAQRKRFLAKHSKAHTHTDSDIKQSSTQPTPTAPSTETTPDSVQTMCENQIQTNTLQHKRKRNDRDSDSTHSRTPPNTRSHSQSKEPKLKKRKRTKAKAKAKPTAKAKAKTKAKAKSKSKSKTKTKATTKAKAQTKGKAKTKAKQKTARTDKQHTAKNTQTTAEADAVCEMDMTPDAAPVLTQTAHTQHSHTLPLSLAPLSFPLPGMQQLTMSAFSPMSAFSSIAPFAPFSVSQWPSSMTFAIPLACAPRCGQMTV